MQMANSINPDQNRYFYSLIWIHTNCLDLSVRILSIITVNPVWRELAPSVCFIKWEQEVCIDTFQQEYTFKNVYAFAVMQFPTGEI